MSEVYGHNSEILFIYEAKLCNPNGDPDDENRLRTDPRTRINLVSDVRLKRFFRNYVSSLYGEHLVWINTVDGKHVDATERYRKLAREQEDDPVRLVTSRCIDARLFGATIPLKADKDQRRTEKEIQTEEKEAPIHQKGESISVTGPVQFTWGFSLHPVELVDSPTITSVFKGRESTEAGTIGKDWRLYYSLIAFYGVISGRRATRTGLNHMDVKILDNLLWDAICMDATTRWRTSIFGRKAMHSGECDQ